MHVDQTLGTEHGIAVPRAVNRHKVEPKELISALGHSSRGIIKLLTLGCDRGGTIPISSSYTWRNLPLDVGHVLTYFVRMKVIIAGRLSCSPARWAVVCPLRLRVVYGTLRSAPKRLLGLTLNNLKCGRYRSRTVTSWPSDAVHAQTASLPAR